MEIKRHILQASDVNTHNRRSSRGDWLVTGEKEAIVRLLRANCGTARADEIVARTEFPAAIGYFRRKKEAEQCARRMLACFHAGRDTATDGGVFVVRA